MDGILIARKEKGYSSNYVVRTVKKLTKTKVGHVGTLDPMATGVLPLILGDGTKLAKYLVEHDKIYESIVQLGQKTETADIEGHVIEEKEVNESLLNKENIEKIFKSLLGKQIQIPPIYSAIKVKGKKLYEYARNNQTVEVPKREIEIYEMKLVEVNNKSKTITFKVHCSKGTYIRSLCETIAQKLETVGYMKELNRVKVGNFSIDQAVTLEEIENNINSEDFLDEHFITIEKFFNNKPIIILDDYKLKLFLNGVQLTRKEENDIYKIYNKERKFIGIGVIENNLLKRDIIIN